MAVIGIQLSRTGFYHQESFRGICDYARRFRPNWRFRFVDPARPVDDLTELDGLVVASRTDSNSASLGATGLPVVNLSTQFEDPHLIQIWLDDLEIGRTAALHLHQRGFRRWAYFGFDDHLGSRRRRDGFIQGLAELGYSTDDLAMDVGDWADEDRQPATVLRLIGALRDDPRPIGCFTFDDALGADLIELCISQGLEIPKRLSVIGAANDDFLCETSFPTLSSIDINHRGRGFEAARMLATLMNHESIDMPTQPIAPVGLVVRESTGPATTGDAIVDKAVAFIHANARRDIRVDDVLDQVNVSRRALERRFRAALNWSPHQQIIHAKVEEVKQLLLTTDMDTEAIAEASGFNQRAHLSRVFRRATGLTMMQFRGRTRKDRR